MGKVERMTGELKDPFENSEKFLLFMNKEDYSLQALQLVNESKGRYYVNALFRQMAEKADYSALIPKALCWWVGLGGIFELVMYECGEDNRQFPIKGFNQKFINYLVLLDPKKPFLKYQEAILTIYTGHYALKAMNLSSHSDLCALIEHGITNTSHSTEYRERWQKLHPTVPFPESGEGWGKIKGRQGKWLNELAWSFERGLGSIEEATQEVDVKLIGLINKEIGDKPETLIDAGLKDKLPSYLREAVQNDLKDKRKHDSLFVKGIPESQLDIETEEGTTPFFETVPSEEPEPWEKVEERERIQQMYNQAGLTKMERLVADLRAGGYEHKDIAGRLSGVLNKPVKETTVRQHWSNARKKIKSIMERID